jgi:hypothetical protein
MSQSSSRLTKRLRALAGITQNEQFDNAVAFGRMRGLHWRLPEKEATAEKLQRGTS